MSEPVNRQRVLSMWVLWVTVSFVLFAGGCLVAVSNMHFDFGATADKLPPPPPVSEYGTWHEIGTRGDDSNPRELYHGAFPSDADTQERAVGKLPARFSGYTTWVRSVRRVPARPYVGAYPGDFLRVHVTVFNRDQLDQHVCACDFFVWTSRAGFREADAIAARTLSPDTTMRSGAIRNGDVYLYVGTVPGPYFVVYNPDAHVPGHASLARGAWRVPRS